MYGYGVARMRVKATYHSTKNQMTCVFEGSRDGAACMQCCSSLATPAYVTMHDFTALRPRVLAVCMNRLMC